MYCTIEHLQKDMVRLIVYNSACDPETRIVHDFASMEQMDRYIDKCLKEKKISEPVDGV